MSGTKTLHWYLDQYSYGLSQVERLQRVVTKITEKFILVRLLEHFF